VTQVKISENYGGKMHGQSSNALTLTALHGKDI